MIGVCHRSITPPLPGQIAGSAVFKRAAKTKGSITEGIHRDPQFGCEKLPVADFAAAIARPLPSPE
jgi:hypothetical protein